MQIRERYILKFRWTRKRGVGAAVGKPICTLYVNDQETTLCMGQGPQRYICFEMWAFEVWKDAFQAALSSIDRATFSDDSDLDSQANVILNKLNYHMSLVAKERDLDIYLVEPI